LHTTSFARGKRISHAFAVTAAPLLFAHESDLVSPVTT
jgi:hypothetical protein